MENLINVLYIREIYTAILVVQRGSRISWGDLKPTKRYCKTSIRLWLDLSTKQKNKQNCKNYMGISVTVSVELLVEYVGFWRVWLNKKYEILENIIDSREEKSLYRQHYVNS